MLAHKHIWRNSREFFVGSLYPSIYPWYCECGAFRKEDLTILEPFKKEVESCGKCPIKRFCATTRDKPKDITPKNCPLLKGYLEETLK